MQWWLLLLSIFIMNSKAASDLLAEPSVSTETESADDYAAQSLAKERSELRQYKAEVAEKEEKVKKFQSELDKREETVKKGEKDLEKQTKILSEKKKAFGDQKKVLVDAIKELPDVMNQIKKDKADVEIEAKKVKAAGENLEKSMNEMQKGQETIDKRTNDMIKSGQESLLKVQNVAQDVLNKEDDKEDGVSISYVHTKNYSKCIYGTSVLLLLAAFSYRYYYDHKKWKG